MATQRGSYITFFTLVGDISCRQVIFTSVGDISRRQANTRDISDILHFTAIDFLPERHSTNVYINICICYSTGRSDIRDIFHEL